jgi:2,5-diketo-D-gluconate reductase A
MTIEKTVQLNDGNAMPRVGFGIWRMDEEEAEAAVATALEVGYRSIDTAALYENEPACGRAIAASGLARDEIFVTTKLDNVDHGKDRVAGAFERSRENLGLEYVDLYLIHWPIPKLGLYVETWKAMEGLVEKGVVRSIGVSNFKAHHLESLAEVSEVVPAVNQIELNPYLTQAETRAYDTEKGIVTEAWAPLAVGEVLENEVIAGIAARVERSPAQTILRWHLQIGNVVIPKSVRRERMEENLAVLDFELTGEDVEAISALHRNGGSGLDPDVYNPM